MDRVCPGAEMATRTGLSVDSSADYNRSRVLQIEWNLYKCGFRCVPRGELCPKTEIAMLTQHSYLRLINPIH